MTYISRIILSFYAQRRDLFSLLNGWLALVRTALNNKKCGLSHKIQKPVFCRVVWILRWAFVVLHLSFTIYFKCVGICVCFFFTQKSRRFEVFAGLIVVINYRYQLFRILSFKPVTTSGSPRWLSGITGAKAYAFIPSLEYVQFSSGVSWRQISSRLCVLQLWCHQVTFFCLSFVKK